MGPDQTVLPIMPCRDAATAAYGAHAWADQAGLDADEQLPQPDGSTIDLVPTSWVTVMPLPVARTDRYGPARWPGCDPLELVWPWMWLPARLARPARHRFADDQVVMEPVEVWQARVALEMAAAGLFDRVNGWVDPLMACAGTNVDDPDGYRRVANWMSGDRDTQLDELGDYFAETFLPPYSDEPDWAADEAAWMVWAPGAAGHPAGPMLCHAAAVAAQSLLDILDDPQSPVEAVRLILDIGPAIPGQTSFTEWEQARERFDPAQHTDPWSAKMAIDPARDALERIVGTGRAAGALLESRYSAGGLR